MDEPTPAIDYLREVNRILREQLGQRRLRLNDDQRRRIAAKAKALGQKLLTEVAHDCDFRDLVCEAPEADCREKRW